VGKVLFKAQQRLLRVPVVAVPDFGIPEILARELVFQFHRQQRDPVQEQRHIDGILVF